MPCYVIRPLRLAHCKRGPSRCARCREMDEPRICLLDVCPPQQGELQRRVIALVVDGQRVWREFDIVRVFAGEEEARAYAAAHGIDDVLLAP